MKSPKYLVRLIALALAIQCQGANEKAVCSQPATNANWTTLTSDDGRIVEVAVDFNIEKMEVGSDGEAMLILKAKTDKEEIGFSAELSQFQLSETAVLDPDKFDKVVVCTMTIRSLGELTNALERRVQNEIIEGQTSKRFRFTGVYIAYSYSPVAQLDGLSVFDARAQGVAFDDAGKRIHEPADYFYQVRFFIDGPRKRLTVYFSERAGYGATSNAVTARKQWLKSITTPKK